MKKIFLLLFPTALYLFGNEIITLKGENRDITFLKESESRDAKSISQNSTYYRYGLKNESTKVISNGTIIVNFKTVPDIQQFSKENSLELIRKNSTGTYIFKILENIDIIEKVNELSDLANIEVASPNWKRSRGLK